MINLQGQEGELRFTIEIKRVATGKTETVELIGRITPEQEPEDGSHTLDSSPKRSD